MNRVPIPNVVADRPSSAVQLLERYSVDSPFFFSSPSRTFLVQGACEILREPIGADPVDGLAARVAGVLAALGRSGHDRPLVVGAVPFDDASPAHLLVPGAFESAGPLNRAAITPRPASSVSDVQIRMRPEPHEYLRGVEQALDLMRTGTLSKVVLSRTLELTLPTPVDVQRLLQRLARQNPGGYTFAVDLTDPCASGPGPDRSSSTPRPRTLIGASPELLVSRSGLQVIANPLAGSAARSADPAEDQRRASALLASEKDRREHGIVVAAVVAALRPFCRRLSVPAEASLMNTQAMWHLSTHVTGELADASITSLQLAMALHPTPAVCGSPTARARAAIKAIEPFDRGFFTGVVGWCDAAGDGEWVVTLRCADVTDRSLRLYAGAGIVAGSDAERELAETRAKLRTMLDALGLDRVQELL